MEGLPNRKSRKVVHIVKIWGKHRWVLIHHDPIALRTAKTLWSFGCSECSRVKEKYLLPKEQTLSI